MRSMLALSIVPLALLAVACDDDSKGSGSGTVSAAQAYDKLAETYCSIFASCDLSGDDNLIFGIFAKTVSPAQCKSFVLRVVDTEIDLPAEVAAGRMTFDAAGFTACTSAAKSVCDINALEGCRDVFDGQIPIDGACTYDEACAGDAYCEGSFNGCGGICKARVAIGQPCEDNEGCSAAGGIARCSYSVESSTCQPFSRRGGAAEGAACGYIESADKVEQVNCATGLDCDYDSASNSETCVKTLAQGVACGGEIETSCAGGLVCLPKAGGGATCEAFPLAKEGETCNQDVEAGALAACNPFLQIGCEAGKCKKWGDGSVGSFCGNEIGFDSVCDVGNYCDDAGACQVQKGPGAMCDGSNECADGFCGGDGEQGICEAETCQ